MGRSGQKTLPEHYRVFPRTLCFIVKGAQVLLLRGAPDKRIWPNRLNGVGGHVEANEDVYSAALREISEETGLSVIGLHLCGVINVPVGEHHTGVLLFVFKATASEGEVRPSLEGRLEWTPGDRLPMADMVEDLPIILPRVLSMEPGTTPFFAFYRYDENDRLHIEFAGQ
jgi:8-oxo-dGTP diphosphatase